MPTKASEPSPENTLRRELLVKLAISTGLIFTSKTLDTISITIGALTNPYRISAGFFNKEQLAIVSRLCDFIIPDTDTPGALAAGVPDFLDAFLFYCQDRIQQQKITEAIANIDDKAKNLHQDNFINLGQEKQLSLLTEMELKKNGFTEIDREAIKNIKLLVVLGYYTSEIGATKELSYVANPGDYYSVKFNVIGRAWSQL